MVTRESVISNLKIFAGDMKRSGFHLNKMVLYGSYSNNQQNANSDIDVAIVAEEFTGVGFDDVLLISRLLSKRPDLISVQPRTYNTKDFSADADPFVEEIMRTGIEIV